MAYNLEAEIYNNVESYISSLGELSATIFVMVNGCRDNTLNECLRLKAKYNCVIPVNIEMGDKANAWNEFVYGCYDGESIPVFVDGDVNLSTDALVNIIDYFHQNPKLNSVSSFPWLGGRSGKTWRDNLVKNHEFTGNLYLLSPRFVKKLKDHQVRLPIGLIGDDSMLGYLSATDACSGSDLPHERIGVCQKAIFYYPKLNWLKWSDIRLYVRRRIRYSMRHYQQNEIVENLKLHGLGAMPERALDAFVLNPNALKLNFRGINTMFDWLAIKQIKHGL